MSFGNSMTRSSVIIGSLIFTIVSFLFLVLPFVNAASNCGPGKVFDAGTKTLSLVCTESTDIHELSCSDVTKPLRLSLSVNGVTETVTCPTVPDPPVPPNNIPSVSVSGPSSGDYGVNYTFTLTGTDADSDTIFFNVDWDDDGTIDAVTAPVSSGSSQNLGYSWSVVGLRTFRVQAVDSKGGLSAWVEHQITLGNPPSYTNTASLSASPDTTLDPGDTLTLSWASNVAAQYVASTTCAGSGFDTSNAESGSAIADIPAPNSSGVYSVNCSGPGGSTDASIIIFTRQLPNLTTPLVGRTISTTANLVTGVYDYLDVFLQTNNDGGSNTKTNSMHSIDLDTNNDSTYDTNLSGSLGLIAVGSPVNRTERFTGVKFGPINARATVDSTSAVAETNEGDNVGTLSVTILPPDPRITIVSDRIQVRRGETATLNWNTTATYRMNCTVAGPGVTEPFDPSVNGPTGSRVTQPINAKSVYTLTCVEPITNTTFKSEVTVETVGEVEEI